MPQCGGGHEPKLHAVHAPVVLAPRHLVGVLVEVLAADSMWDAVFLSAEPTEPVLRLIDVGAVATAPQCDWSGNDLATVLCYNAPKHDPGGRSDETNC